MYMYTYMYIGVCIYICKNMIYIYIYTYMKREIWKHMSVYMYIYIYTHTVCIYVHTCIVATGNEGHEKSNRHNLLVVEVLAPAAFEMSTPSCGCRSLPLLQRHSNVAPETGQWVWDCIFIGMQGLLSSQFRHTAATCVSHYGAMLLSAIADVRNDTPHTPHACTLCEFHSPLLRDLLLGPGLHLLSPPRKRRPELDD